MSSFGGVAGYGRTDLGGLLSSQPLVACVATTQPQRARAFYGFVLGLGVIEDTPQALVFDAGGTILRVQKVRAFAPLPHPVLGWQVDDIAAAAQGLAARGIACERWPGLAFDFRDAVSGARSVWFRDPDDNILALLEAPRR
jgi:catechol 2,3-dioxygenase-like lactoylglutathione lyase family enzyme